MPDAQVAAFRPPIGTVSMRRLQDLPVQGTIVELQVSMTRWRCCDRLCDRRTFADQADRGIKPYAPQTGRVAELARRIGCAVVGRLAERLMRRLGMPQVTIGSFVTSSATQFRMLPLTN
jgi:hypothetical protein